MLRCIGRETNLKIKKALDVTKDFTKDTLSQLTGASIQCEPPNSRLYQFTGNLMGAGQDKIPINPAAVLLRGCSLRNIERAYGAVIYAGGSHMRSTGAIFSLSSSIL